MFGLPQRGQESRGGVVAALARACRRFIGLFTGQEVSVAELTPEQEALLAAHEWELLVERQPLLEVQDVDYQPRPKRRNSKAGRAAIAEFQVSVLEEE